QVLLEPTQREWLYAMTTPLARVPGVSFVRDYRLVADSPVAETLSYRVRSYPDMPRGLELPDWERNINLSLPDGGNPRARAMAKQWRAEAGSDAAYIDRLMRWFREELFYYTLQPPVLGSQQIDDFLFRTRAGFCEHYASSMTFMLRATRSEERRVGKVCRCRRWRCA